MIDSGVILSGIAKALSIHKSHISYYIRKAKDLSYVKVLRVRLRSLS